MGSPSVQDEGWIMLSSLSLRREMRKTKWGVGVGVGAES